MKRDFQDGMEQLRKVKAIKFLEPVLYLYKAYGYFCLSEYEAALGEYREHGLDEAAHYNATLCEALVEVRRGRVEEGQRLFKKAHLILPTKMEPHFYLAVV